MSVPATQREIEREIPVRSACAAFRAPGRATVLLEEGGAAGPPEGWGTLLAVEPREIARTAGEGLQEALEGLENVLRTRGRAGGPAETGIVVLLAYPGPARLRGPGLPTLVALSVDTSIRFRAGSALVTVGRGAALSGALDAVARRLDTRSLESPLPTPKRPEGRGAKTSLPRDDYLRAVERIRWHIGRGDIYQANLTQRFETTCTADGFEVYRALAAAAPAPRSALVECSEFAVASVSPETFLRVGVDGEVETWPIKGTRPRGPGEEADREAADELLRSPKDRAELVMIVDLERNDLSRCCLPGSVRVAELAGLRSFAAVHHLVACVRGRLRPDAGPADLLRATFPGGSITGAPKIRAMDILRRLEPVPRGFYTGSLFWFGDDGHVESSILIRTVIVTGGRAWIGAGGGVVADSEPEGEWRESNDKARSLAGVLGFVPEEAV